MTMLKNLQRFDIGQITSIERTPQGFLKVPGFATRTGVFTYKDATGAIRMELRHPDDVFDPISLETLKNVPVTLEHPPKMITPDNFKEYSKGFTTNRVEINRDLVETDVIIADDEAIESVEKGERRELSCGYMADLEEEEGTFNGAPYNFRQKNIRYNHLAVVKSGRGGPEIRLRMDSKDAIMQDSQDTTLFQPLDKELEKSKMDEQAQGDKKKIVIMGQEVELPLDVAGAIESMLDRYDEMRAKILQMEAEGMKDRKDVDINQKGVSPKVPEVQMAPDGKSASKKVGEADLGGAMKAKGLDAEEDEKKKDAEEEEKKKDAEEKEKKDEEEKKKDAEGEGVAKSPVEMMKDELEQMKAKHDAMQAKLDEYASSTMNKAMPSAMGKMDSKEVDKRIRNRVKLERLAEQFVPGELTERFDSMSDDEIRASVIKHRHPNADLEGKSTVYLQSRFDSVVESLEESGKVRKEMGKRFMSEHMDAGEKSDPKTARLKMIQATRESWKQPLSAVKK